MAARAHSADMVARGYFSHTTPEGADPSDRAVAAGYGPFVGENIAAASRGTAISVFSAWRASPGHNANLLGTYSATGLGVAPGYPNGGRGITATQMFGRDAARGSDTGARSLLPERALPGSEAPKGRRSRRACGRRSTAAAQSSGGSCGARRAVVVRTCRTPAEAPLL